MDNKQRCTCGVLPVTTPLVPNSLRGQFVYLGPKPTAKSNYGMGEYLVIFNSGFHLFCVKPIIGYGGHQPQSFDLRSDDGMEIVDAYQDVTFAKYIGRGLVEFGLTAFKAQKRQWCDSVYSDALAQGRAILRIFENSNSKPRRRAKKAAHGG